jgi:uncharacterized protein (TIGR02118 family)
MRKAASVKIVRLVKRRPDFTLAQFKDYWLTRHAEHERHAIEATPLQKVVASIATGEVALGAAVPPFDGMVALYFRNLEEARSTFSGPATAAMREDAKSFTARDGIQPQIFGEEYLIAEKPETAAAMKTSGQLKVIRTVYRRRDLSRAQFRDYWLNTHSKLEDKVIAATEMQRIVATFAVDEYREDPDFEGMAELYFNRIEDIRTMFAGPVPTMMRMDEENFVQMDAPAVRLVAEEYLIGEKGKT